MTTEHVPTHVVERVGGDLVPSTGEVTPVRDEHLMFCSCGYRTRVGSSTEARAWDLYSLHLVPAVAA